MAITISGNGITSANIADSAITSAKINDGTITNADVNDVAASKLTGALPAIDGSALTNLPAGGSWELISSTEITNNVSYVDFTNLGSDQEQVYAVIYSNLLPSLNGSEFGVQGLEGTTPVTLYNNFVSLSSRSNTSTVSVTNGQNDVMMKLSGGGTDSYAGNEGTNGNFFIKGFGGYSLRLNGTYMNRHSSQSYWEGGTNVGATAGGSNTHNFTGLRCLFYGNGSTTYLTQGRISLYKVTHS